MQKYLLTRILVTIILWLVIAGKAQAQFNDSTFYKVQLLANGSINRTNENTAYLLNNGINFDVERERLSLNSANSWIYGKQNGLLTNNDFSSTVTFNFYPYSKRFYYWGLANYNTSFSLKINNQLLAGAGLAYQIFQSDRFLFNVSDGLLWDQSNLAENIGNHLLRNSLRLRLKWVIKQAVTIEQISFVQHALKDRKDYILRNSTTLTVPLKKWISLNTTLTYNKMNVTDSENLLFIYGIVLQNYW